MNVVCVRRGRPAADQYYFGSFMQVDYGIKLVSVSLSVFCTSLVVRNVSI